MRSLICLLILLFLQGVAYSQQAVIKGTITDANTHDTLIGVNVMLDGVTSAISDMEGQYELIVSSGDHMLEFQYIGYDTLIEVVHILPADTIVIDIQLEEAAFGLEMVVVTATKFEQKIEELTVSTEVIQQDLIEDKNTYSMETIMEQVPSVNVLGGQANIRGGSGFSYGAGSRVMLLVDGLPLLSADAGDIKWNFLPVENIEQVEVIKGAASALYGSSALNGVINIRTAYPKGAPETKVNVFHGIYNDPVRRDSTGKLTKPLKWWRGASPIFSGVNLSHSRIIKNLDLVIGGNAFSDQGYREGESEQRIRMNVNTRYRFKKREGLYAGINVNAMLNNGSTFLLWQDADSGAYRPFGGVDPETTTLSFIKSEKINIDPYIKYIIGKRNDIHSLKTRYYYTNNVGEAEQSSLAHLYYAEYNYQAKLKKDLVMVYGVVNTYSIVKSELYGDHTASNLAFYSQLDKKLGRFKLSAGLRGEWFRVDSVDTKADIVLPKALQFRKDREIVKDSVILVKGSPVKPVLRLGVNYRLFNPTFLRLSFGGGYRFPSIAEKFISTEIGGLNIFANPDLLAETGWSGEIGVKQVVKWGNWVGYFDVAGFITEYNNMMEFTFGQYFPDSITSPNFLEYLEYSGFKSLNVGNTRITGLDISVITNWQPRKMSITFWGGYTYMNPINVNPDSAYTVSLSDTTSTFLKYRFKHMFKADIQVDYRKWSCGISTRYNSFMVNVDRSFEEPLIGTFEATKILRGLKEYREEHNKGDIVFDLRVSMRITDQSKVAVIVNNVLNREYMGRPGDMQPPRTVALRYTLSF